MNRLPSIFLLFVLCSFSASAQQADSFLLHKEWQASWIAVPGESQQGYGIYLFRKSFVLQSKPETFVIHVSGDNRYKLFVNQKLVSLGPARGDADHWHFETLDISPYLQEGTNIIASQVWNEGEWRAEGQISLRTGFILQGTGDAGQIVNTNNEWKCIRDSSYRPLPYKPPTYYVAGPGEQISMKDRQKDWQKTDFVDSSWKNAMTISPGIPKGLIGGYGTISGWLLESSIIPQMELKKQRLLLVSYAEGVKIIPGFPSVKTSITVPANTNATILLDQGFLTNAYPEMIISGGDKAGISLTYAEALFNKYPSKGNRNETDGKIISGRKDSIISNGMQGQFFTTLSFRTYRYLQLKINTREDPLVVEDISGTATGYPFLMNARLETNNPEISKILEIGWRTARLCAMETYMDCPYYEQLQYIGDSRIQALISIYNSGDERLLRNAMNEMDNSRRPEGVTLSRHPSYTPQLIPTFSFWYIGMLHDYMMYGKDSLFIKDKLAGERQILSYFRKYQQADGSLKGVPFWMFTDWVEKEGWKDGVGPVGRDGSSSLTDLQLLWAYQLAADLEIKMGMPTYATLYLQYADQLKKTIRKKYWDHKKNLFADRPEMDFYSQHANSLAILTGMFDHVQAKVVARQLLTDTTLAPASIYFKFYLHSAFIKAGLGNDYLNWLDIWRENMKLGLTTWAEISDINNARSDCHAWGASPNIEFFRTLLGIDSDAPGFAKVKIEPHLGELQSVSGEIPHPRGSISVSYQRENGRWNIQVNLPDHVTGQLIWDGKSIPLKGGNNQYFK
jgi:alpha-L-rhamnosidase